jgi:cytochrome P450
MVPPGRARILPYFPFGGGPRTCIGNTFAEIEGSAVLGHICRRYELRVPPHARVAPYLGVTLLPRGNVFELEVRRRTATRPSSERAIAPPSPQG